VVDDKKRFQEVNVKNIKNPNNEIINETETFSQSKREPEKDDMKRIPKVFESEYRFCLVLWENEPLSASALAKICKEKLEWSRTTTYTVIKRLSERGIVETKDSIVRSLVTKGEVQLSELDELVEKRFEGSLPAFIAAFAKRHHLSEDKIEEIRKMIEEAKDGE
jgi:predicted transcriptional regulator